MAYQVTGIDHVQLVEELCAALVAAGHEVRRTEDVPGTPQRYVGGGHIRLFLLVGGGHGG